MSDFRLRALFPNGIINYVVEDEDAVGYLKLIQNATNPALFGLTAKTQLRLESQGTLSMISMENVMPRPLVFYPNDTLSINPLGFEITNGFKADNGTVFPVDSLGDIRDPSNITVIVACQRGLCIGTHKWQSTAFDADNMTSKDGAYQLVDLQAQPMY